MGPFGVFSFFPTKNLGGFGDAGLLVMSDDALAGKARLLRAHGAQSKYFHKTVGGNFRLDPLQAALLGVKLQHREEYGRKRAGNACYYNAKLSGIEGAAVNCTANGACGDEPERADLRRRAAFLLAPVPHQGR